VSSLLILIIFASAALRHDKRSAGHATTRGTLAPMQMHTAEQYFSLTNEQKRQVYQELNPYDSEQEIVLAVQKKFVEQYGHLENIDGIKCAMTPILGPHLCILVFIPKGKNRLSLPDTFEGFPVEKIYESHYKTYKTLLRDYKPVKK
jgi:hypothetical protein